MSCPHHLSPHRLPGARRTAAVDSARSRAPRALLLADARACLKSCNFAWSSSLGCAPCCCAPRAPAGAVPSVCLVTSVCWRRFESACAVGSSWAQAACLPIFADSARARARARAARLLASPPATLRARTARPSHLHPHPHPHPHSRPRMSSSVYAASTSAHDEARSKCLQADELTLDTVTSSLDEILTLDDWMV
jgi:hypothetical protein